MFLHFKKIVVDLNPPATKKKSVFKVFKYKVSDILMHVRVFTALLLQLFTEIKRNAISFCVCLRKKRAKGVSEEEKYKCHIAW